MIARASRLAFSQVRRSISRGLTMTSPAAVLIHSSLAHSLRNRYPVFDPIARMLDHAIAGSEARDHLRQTIVPMANLNRRHARTAVPNSKDSPPFATSEQRTNRHGQRVFATPHCYMYRYPIVVPETRPRFRRIDEVDRDMHTLLLDAECGNLEEPCRVDARHPRPDW